MADVRLVPTRTTRLWGLVVALSFVGLILWASAFVFGDATAPEELPGVGASAGFGSTRAPVLPAYAVPFGTLTPLQTRDLGRLVHLTGWAESGIAASSLWVRTAEGYRILVRFEPAPPAELLRGIGPGSPVAFNGYLQDIAVAEFLQLVDSLNVQIPRPPPARKFGDLPDPGFARVDSLFIKAFYISVRPEGIRPDAPSDETASSE